MESIFIKVLENLTIVMGGKYAGYFALGITLSIIIVFVCQLLYSVTKSKKSNYSFTKFAIFSTVCTLFVSLCEHYTLGRVFKSVYYSIIFTLLNLIISFIFSFVLDTVNYVLDGKLKTSQPKTKEEPFDDKKLQVASSTKKALLKLKTQPLDLYNLENVTNEFIDVSYIKELINSLKDKPLTIKESEELEEFEVFLLNFCYRQPNKNEKEKLSLHLSSLMKKLAYYKIVE